MSIALLQELQLTVFNVLSGDAVLRTHVGKGIFDFVPDTSKFPYIVLDSFQSVDDPTKDADGEAATFQLHIWSEERSNLVISKIVAAVKTVLHNKVFRMSQSVANNMRLSSSNILRDPDGIHRQGVLRFTTNLHEDLGT
jgi:hypothetical protein